jgi:hypothetical protein
MCGTGEERVPSKMLGEYYYGPTHRQEDGIKEYLRRTAQKQKFSGLI